MGFPYLALSYILEKIITATINLDLMYYTGVKFSLQRSSSYSFKHIENNFLNISLILDFNLTWLANSSRSLLISSSLAANCALWLDR